MLSGDKERLSQDIVALAQKYGKERSALLPILQSVMERYHHISDMAMQEVADLLSIHPVEVYGVATFYSFLKPEKSGTFTIRLCRTISCDMQGKEKVAKQLENELGILFGETTKDGRFSLEWTNCLGMCEQGPALLVNDRVFAKVTPKMVREIIEECKMQFSSFTFSKEV
jgi:NADH:ubiquinone oxidoreductase subunit E